MGKMSDKKVSDDTIFDKTVFFGNEPIVIDEEDAKAILNDIDEMQEDEEFTEKPINNIPKIEEVEGDFSTQESAYPIPDKTIDDRKEGNVQEKSIQSSHGKEMQEIEEEEEIDYTFFDLPKRKRKAIQKKEKQHREGKSKISDTEEEFSDELDEEHEMIVEPQTKVKTKKRKNPIAIIFNILAFLFFLFIIFETAIAFLNFNLVRQNKEPEYFVTTKKEKRGEVDYTIHDMGLFKIVRKEDKKEFEIKLLPFFLDI